MTQDQETLSKYGSNFQIKSISCMLSDKSFLDQAHDIIDKKHFESDAHSWIVGTILWYFSEYKSLPSMEVFKTELDKVKTDSTLKSNIIISLKDVYKNLSTDDGDYIKDEYLKFCKNQALKNAILKSADLLPTGNYDGIMSVMTKAMQAGTERDYGHDWKIDIDDRFSETARVTVPTNWKAINDLLDGGLGPGELGVVVAPPGIGKTWALCNIGTAAMRAGLKVLQYSFELSEKYVGLRYDTTFTGIEPREVRNNIELVKKKVDTIPGELMVKSYPTRSCNSNTLKAHMNRLEMIDFRPDLVIVDYADLMRPTEKGDARYQDLGTIYEDLRGMAAELDIPVWTASQSQRSSMDDDIIEASKIAESFSKIMTADFIISLSRKLSDKTANTGRAHVIKNRFGSDGITFPSKINFMNGTFEIYDENTPEGRATADKMAGSDDIIKKLMKKSKIEYDPDAD